MTDAAPAADAATTATPAAKGDPAVIPENPAPGQGDSPADPSKAKDPKLTAERQDGEGKRPNGVQKRIDELTRDRRALERQNEYLLNLLSHREPGKPAVPGTAKDEPRREDFEDLESYIEARTTWKAEGAVEAKLAERERKATEARQADESTAMAKSWNERLDKARTKFDDYDDVVSNEDVPISQAMGEAIMRADLGAEIAYYLGKNPDDAKRISRLSPIAAAIEIGKIEAKLTATPPKPKPSNAPEPIEPLGGKASVTQDEDGMSVADWMKKRTAQVRKH